VSEYFAAFDAYDEDDFQRVFAVNTLAPYFMSVAFLSLLDASKGKKFTPTLVQ